MFYVSPDEDSRSITYLKLHGSFNWYYCWRCENFNVSVTRILDSSLRTSEGIASFGGWPLLALQFGSVRREKDCPWRGASQLKPLIIPPARMKEYSQAPVLRHWALFDLLLMQAQVLILVGDRCS